MTEAPMTDLIQRLEAAEAGSRELDAEVAKALGWTDHREFAPMGHGWKTWYKDASGKVQMDIPEWTESLDAALALVEAKLPGWGRVSGKTSKGDAEQYGKYFCRLIPGLEHEGYASAAHDIEALALCIALLKAIQEEG